MYAVFMYYAITIIFGAVIALAVFSVAFMTLVSLIATFVVGKTQNMSGLRGG